MKAEKIIQEKKSKINELKSKLPNSLAVYSIKIILAISSFDDLLALDDIHFSLPNNT